MDHRMEDVMTGACEFTPCNTFQAIIEGEIARRTTNEHLGRRGNSFHFANAPKNELETHTLQKPPLNMHQQTGSGR